MSQHPSPSFVLSSAFVARVAGLPIETWSALRFSRTYRLLARSLRLEYILTRRAEGLSAELHDAIGLLNGPEYKQIRQRLISLRRAIFHGKMPAARDMANDLFAFLPPALAERVRRWLLGLRQLQNLFTSVQNTLADELTSKHTALLQEIAGSEGSFSAGVLLGSKDLYMDWQRWLNKPTQPDRKLTDGMMNYLARMIAKVSPYSTFTSLTRGHWTVGHTHAPLAYHCAETWEYESIVEANYLLVRQLASALINSPQVRPHLALKVNTTLCINDQSYQFVTHTSQNEETVLRLKPTNTLQHFLSLAQEPGMTYGLALRMLHAADKQGRTEAITRFLDQLIAQGLLLLSFPISDQSPDYLADLITFLQSLPEPCSPDLLARLIDLRDHLRKYAQISWAEDTLARQRHRTLNQIQQCFADLFALLLPESQLPAKNLLYETTLLHNLDLRCSRAAFPEIAADLGAIQQLTGLYDPQLPARLVLSAYFLAHYAPNAQVGLLDFYAQFLQEIQANSVPNQPNYAALAQQLFTVIYPSEESTLPEISQLVELRQKVVRWLRAQPVSDHWERQIDRAALNELLADLPAYIQTPLTLAYYCQIILSKGQPRLVLNSVQGGFGRTLARLNHVTRLGSDNLASCATDAPFAPRSAKPLPVSIQGVFGSNINLSVASLPYEIAYPGVVSQRAPEEQLPLEDLLVQYDPETGHLQLFSQRLQTTLLPVHMGMMSNYWLPPLYQFLTRTFSNAPIDPLWSLRLVDTPGLEDHHISTGVIRTPRLVIGQTIVARARWLVAADAVPHREKQETDSEYLCKVERWRAQHEIPQECFLRVNAFDFAGRNLPSGKQSYVSLSKKRKPLPIDFQNYFLFQVFEHQITESPFGFILEEALPASDQHVLRRGNVSYASEYIFELYQEARS